MNLDQYRTRPAWPIYEQALIEQGWAPSWTPEVEALVVATSIACPDCRQLPAYVGMRKGPDVLAFLVCREPCSRWSWFRPPSHLGGPW
jgi:hypothetical protein